jgi:ribonuclease D
VQYEHITTDQQLLDFCESITDSKLVAFDTEFVSEDTYRPELCLVQLAAGGQLALVDPQPIEDLSPLWDLLCDPAREIIIHSAREEFHFCLRLAGRRPGRLFDVQIAAGFVGFDYPASLKNLVAHVLNETLPKGETRTDWRRRPLSKRQLEYALFDVVHLEELRNKLAKRLEKLGRTGWFREEMLIWQDDQETAESRERWRRVSGVSGLKPRALAIVRELWRWRESEARRRNQPPKRVLRDDLIVELARRGTSDVKRIRALRGLERGYLQRHLPTIAACIERANGVPDSELPRSQRRDTPRKLTVVGQFLATVVSSICRSSSIAPGLVATVQDVRDLIAHQLGVNGPIDEPPALAHGWRAEIVGNVVEDMLKGNVSVRIDDALSDDPLVLERR